MIPHFRPNPGRPWVVAVARHRLTVAFGTWVILAGAAIAYVVLNGPPSGPSMLRDSLSLTGLALLAVGTALLVLFSLRLVSQNVHTRTLAETIVANAPVGMLTTDRTGRVTWENPVLINLFDEPTPTGMVGRILSEFPSVRGTILQDQMDRALKGASFTLIDFEYTTVNGKTLFLSTNGVPLVAQDGSLDGVMLFVEDTTARRKWQTELENHTTELMRRTHEMEMLRDISLGIASTLELDPILDLVYDRVSRLLDTDTFFIALTDETRPELGFPLIVDHGDKTRRFSQTMGPETRLCEWVIEHARPLLIGELQDRDAIPVTLASVTLPARSWLGVPLAVKDRLIGVMAVQSDEANHFDSGHMRLLDSVANEISIVIENARLYQQTRARADELAAAHEITRAINSTLNLDQVLRLFFDQLTRLFNSEAGALVLIDPLTDELVFQVVYGGAGSTLARQRMPKHSGIVGWVTQNGQSLLVPDVHQDPRWFQGFDEHTQFVTRSIVAAPIRVQDRVIGAVELINRTDNRPFTPTDQKMLDSFASSAGIAIENARLHQQTEKRLSQMIAINAIADKLATRLTEAEIMPAMATHVKLLFDARACAIHLLDTDRQILTLAAEESTHACPFEPAVPLGRGIVGRAAQTGQTVFVAASDQAPPGLALPPASGCMLSVPLCGRDAVLGTVSLENEMPYSLTGEDQRTLQTVAAQIAAAIENSRLNAALAERAARLEQTSAELREVDRLKTEFVQNVSHELRTPLTFIKGYVELVRSGAFGDLPARAAAGMDGVAAKTDALIRLVNDILSLQRAESTGLGLQTIDLGLLAHSCVQAAVCAATQAHVDLAEQIAPALPDVLGDPARLSEVFENLIGNAIKFSPDGGEVRVVVQPVADGVQVEIRDHGIGIPADQIDKVFDRFYQVDGSTTRRFGGTGLGLAIVKRTIAAHHGNLWCESQVGVGSTFCFFLPAPPSTPDNSSSFSGAS